MFVGLCFSPGWILIINRQTSIPLARVHRVVHGRGTPGRAPHRATHTIYKLLPDAALAPLTVRALGVRRLAVQGVRADD